VLFVRNIENVVVLLLVVNVPDRLSLISLATFFHRLQGDRHGGDGGRRRHRRRHFDGDEVSERRADGEAGNDVHRKPI